MTIPKILLIDDNKDLLDILSLLLQRKGYEVISGQGGAEGIRLATEHQPDLALLDIMMPDISGDEVLEEIRRRKIPTRVIMLTARFESIRDVIRYIKAGACDYLLKPISNRDLVNAIKRALALESTINLVASDTTPLINTLMINAEKLERENEQLRDRNRWINFTIRLIYLLAASLVAVTFHRLHILTSTQALFFLPIVIFILLLFPVERIKILSAKSNKAETRVEVESIKE